MTPREANGKASVSAVGKEEFQLRYNNNKAGLEMVDQSRTEAVIQQMSRGTKYHSNEWRKAQMLESRLRDYLHKRKMFTRLIEGEKNAAARKQLEEKVAQCEAELEAERTFGNFVHVDMDMFFAAVEIKKKPELVNVPLGVGGNSMLSTTNYIARSYGVRSGMPGYIGKKLCSSLVIVPPDFAAYRAEAEVVRRIAAEYDPKFVSCGLDELTMEVSDYLRRHNGTKTAADVASEFRARVFSETQLTSSAGIGPTAMLSKIASNYQKPNGQQELSLSTRQEVVEFMRELPVRTVPGIGQATESILHGLGVKTLGDVYQRRLEFSYLFTDKLFRFLLGSSLGVTQLHSSKSADSVSKGSGMQKDETGGGGDSGRKSFGREVTFSSLSHSTELQNIALTNVQEAHKNMVDSGMVCRQVVLKIKWKSFRVQQFTKNLMDYSDDVSALSRAVDELVLPICSQFANIRLLGVRCTDLMSKEKFMQRQKGAMQCSILSFCTRKNTLQWDKSCCKRRRLETWISVDSSDVSDAEDTGVICLSTSTHSTASLPEENDAMLIE
ncbi:impB mucB samB family impB mucB samB family C terminal domain [Trypanosoma vivax]|nr:impB mucB samB family impB mucB samB family C terminal domain [Trypanosoma vivax]